MKAGKREKGKIYAYRTIKSSGFNSVIKIYLGEATKTSKWFCYRIFSQYTGIKLKPGQMKEIEVIDKGVVD